MHESFVDVFSLLRLRMYFKMHKKNIFIYTEREEHFVCIQIETLPSHLSKIKRIVSNIVLCINNHLGDTHTKYETKMIQS